MEKKQQKKNRIGFLMNILRQIKYLIPRYYV